MLRHSKAVRGVFKVVFEVCLQYTQYLNACINMYNAMYDRELYTKSERVKGNSFYLHM